MGDDTKRSLLDAAFFGSPAAQVSPRPGSLIQPLAEEIGRITALAEVLASPKAQPRLDRVLDQLEGALAAEIGNLPIANARPSPGMGKPQETVRMVKPKPRYPIPLSIEGPITPEEEAKAPLYFMYEPVVFAEPGSALGSLERPGKVLGVYLKKSGWMVDIKDARKQLVRVPARHVRGIGAND